MKEYFISYYRIDYPICRACWNTDFDTIQIQKNKDCFTALSDNCDERSPYCNWDDCNSCPCTCLTEPCPLQTRVLHCRCSIGELLENEIEYFERKSRIEENPDYVLHKDIALETIDERHEHMKSLQEFSRYCEERDSDDIDIVFLFRPIPHIDSMVQFIILAQEIRALRKKKPAITVKPTEPAHADSPSQIKAEHNVPIELEEMYYAAKTNTSEPYETALVEIDTPALKDIEQAVYAGTLRANIDSKQTDKKYERWARSKNDIGHMESAKYERPDLAERAEKGNEHAQKDLELLSDEIRKQVKRFDNRLAKQPSTQNERKTS